MFGGPEVVKILETMARDKAIDREVLFESLEIAMVAAARKKFVDAEVLDVTVDRITGEFAGTRDEIAIDDDTLETLGRIAAQTFKQVMMQKIREAEQDVVFDEYVDRKGTLVTGSIQRFEGDTVICDVNRTECILPRHERVRTETYQVGDRIRAVISDVRKVGHRVRVVLSRTHPDLIRRLFELEIPEIADHIIEVKALAREPGFRTKLAVVSYDSKVDCVGACVGIRGSRIRNIIDELNGEKIDIIRWNESPEVLIMNSLKPAEIMSITLDDETMEAVVTVAEDQLSLAIGKRGQNVRLAARLTGWDVNIVGTGGDRSGGEDRSKPLSADEQRLLEQLRTGKEIEAPAAVAAEVPDAAAVEAAAIENARDPLLEMAIAAEAKSSAEAEAAAAESEEKNAADDGATDEVSGSDEEEGGDPLLALARTEAANMAAEADEAPSEPAENDQGAETAADETKDPEERGEKPVS